MNKIYLKLEKEPENVRELLKELFNAPSTRDYEHVANVKTYYNKECTMLQCSAGLYRSFDDIYACCRTYFPEITDIEVLKTLLSLDIKNGDNRNLYYYMGNCNDIKRIISFYCTSTPYYTYAISITQYESKWSWKELLDKAEIFSQKDLDLVINNRS